MRLRSLEPEDGDRIVLVTGAPGTRCFSVALIGDQLHWESFSDSFDPASQSSFGSYRLQPQQQRGLEESFLNCRSFAQNVEPGRRRLELKFLEKGAAKTLTACVGGVSAASNAAETLLRCCWQLLSKAVRADAAHTDLCFNTEDFGTCSLRDGEVLMIERSRLGAEKRVRLRVVNLLDPSVTPEHVEALTREATPTQSAPTLTQLGPGAPRSTRRPGGLFAMRVGLKIRTFLRENNTVSFDAVFMHVQSGEQEWAKAASITDSIRRSRSNATSLASGIRRAVPQARVMVAKPTRAATVRLVSDRQQLERRLGSPYALDGSFASLWAFERVLTTLRRAPNLIEEARWMAPYLAQVFGRALLEMGADIVWHSTSSLDAHFPDANYNIDTAKDIGRLLDPPKRFPSFYGQYWAGLQGFGPAQTPWYGLATIFQNHAWAQTDHRPIGEQRTRMDRAILWLVNEQVTSLHLKEEHQELAKKIARAMVWPPLGYPMNERGEHNLPKLREVLSDADPSEARTVLDAFVGMQDRAFQLLAAATSIHFAIPPDSRHEAIVYRAAKQYFQIRDVPPFIEEAIRNLGANLETPLRGRGQPAYQEVYNASPEYGLRLAETVLKNEPNLPAFQCMAGRHHELLSHDTPALRCYTRAIELKPDYVQALINRGSLYARIGDFARADDDFFSARQVRPEDDDLRNSLLLNFFFASKAPAAAESAAPAKFKPAPLQKSGGLLSPDRGEQKSLYKATSAFPVQAIVPDGTILAERLGSELRAALGEYAKGPLGMNGVMRALASHKHFVVPFALLPKGAKTAPELVFSTKQEFSPRHLFIFTDVASAKRTHAQTRSLGALSTGHSATDWTAMFDPLLFEKTVINAGGPADQQWVISAGHLPTLQLWLRGLAVETAALMGETEGLRLALNAQGLSLRVAQTSDRSLLLKQWQGTSYAQVTTTPDTNAALSQTLDSGCAMRRTTPAELRAALEAEGIEIFVLHGQASIIHAHLLRG